MILRGSRNRSASSARFDLVCPLLAAALFVLLSQSPAGAAKWAFTSGAGDDFYLYNTVTTADGGYLVVGRMWTDNATAYAYCAKLSSTGNPVWEKRYDYFESGASDFNEWFSDACSTPDGGYVLVGGIWSHYLYSDVAWCVRITGEGSIVWQRMFGLQTLSGGVDQTTSLRHGEQPGGVIDHAFRRVQRTRDGGYLAFGQTGDWCGYGENNVLCVKLTDGGDTQWWKGYGRSLSGWGDTRCWAGDFTPTKDGGYVLVSTEEGVGGAEINDIYFEQMGTVTWLNSGGKLVRQLLLIQPDPYGYDLNDVIQLADGGFIIVGAEDPDEWGSTSDPDLWVVKMNKAGKLLSQTSYDCGGDENGYVLAPGPDGSLVLGGTTLRKGSEEDVLLLSRKGETVSWARTFGGKKAEYLSGQVGFSTAGELTFMGSTYSFGARKAMALHADTGGNSCPSFMHTVKVTSRSRDTPKVVAGKSTARQCSAGYQGAVTQATVADIALPQSALCQSLDNPEP